MKMRPIGVSSERFMEQAIGFGDWGEPDSDVEPAAVWAVFADRRQFPVTLVNPSISGCFPPRSNGRMGVVTPRKYGLPRIAKTTPFRVIGRATTCESGSAGRTVVTAINLLICYD
jgi:hypothetical protein